MSDDEGAIIESGYVYENGRLRECPGRHTMNYDALNTEFQGLARRYDEAVVAREAAEARLEKQRDDYHKLVAALEARSRGLTAALSVISKHHDKYHAECSGPGSARLDVQAP